MKQSLVADLALYGSIAFLTVIIATPDPVTWRGVATAILSALVTIKAKRSQGTTETKEQL